jgi:hypothetical protein
VKMKSSLLWDVMQRRLLVVTEILGKPISPIFRWLKHYRKIVLVLLKFGPIGCPETSITNYQSKPRKILEEQRSDFVCGLSHVLFSRSYCIHKAKHIFSR